MLTVWSCSTTRRIDEGELLYCGVSRVEIVPDSGAHFSAGVRSAVKEAVDVPPNNYWKLVGWHYPFPLGLWVYNNWPRAEKGFKHWIYENLVFPGRLDFFGKPFQKDAVITFICLRIHFMEVLDRMHVIRCLTTG